MTYLIDGYKVDPDTFPDRTIVRCGFCGSFLFGEEDEEDALDRISREASHLCFCEPGVIVRTATVEA